MHPPEPKRIAWLILAGLCIALGATPATAQIMPPVADPAANSRALLDKLQGDGADPFVAEVMRLLKKKWPIQSIILL